MFVNLVVGNTSVSPCESCRFVRAFFCSYTVACTATYMLDYDGFVSFSVSRIPITGAQNRHDSAFGIRVIILEALSTTQSSQPHNRLLLLYRPSTTVQCSRLIGNVSGTISPQHNTLVCSQAPSQFGLKHNLSSVSSTISQQDSTCLTTRPSLLMSTPNIRKRAVRTRCESRVSHWYERAAC